MFRFEPSLEKLSELCLPSDHPDLLKDLRFLIEVLLYASLQRYEGQAALATLLLVAEGSPADDRDILFKTPLRVTSDSIRNLAPATTRHNMLIVRRVANELCVTGLGEPRAGALLTSPSPGCIIVHTGRKTGIFDWQRSDIFADLPSALHQMIEHNVTFDDGRKSYDWARATSLLLARVRGLGRGGAILMVPTDAALDAALAPSQFTLARPSPRFLAAADAEYDLYRATRAMAKNEYYATQRGEAPDWSLAVGMADLQRTASFELEAGLDGLSQLTAIDGALVLNYSFEIVAFGAKIKSTTEPTVIHSVNFATGERVVMAISEVGGTRHQSALRFVADIKGSIAFVCSQDGAVSIASCDHNGQVVRWRNVEVALMAAPVQHLARGPG